MTGALVFPAVDLRAIGPALVLAITGVVVLLLDLLPPRDRKDHLGLVGLAGVVASLVLTLRMWGADARAFRGMVALDGYALFFNLVIGYSSSATPPASSSSCRWTTSAGRGWSPASSTSWSCSRRWACC